MDVKTIFFHKKLKKEVYITQLQSFAIPRKEHMVCKLKKELYGLKQAP